MESNNYKQFEWTDELVAEYSLSSQPLSLFEFKRSKEKVVEQPIKVIDFIYGGQNAINMDGYTLLTNGLIPKEKYSEIKQAIESALNPTPPSNEITITSEQLRGMMENIFNAARLTNPLVGMKYDTFNDYSPIEKTPPYNSIEKNKFGNYTITVPIEISIIPELEISSFEYSQERIKKYKCPVTAQSDVQSAYIAGALKFNPNSTPKQEKECDYEILSYKCFNEIYKLDSNKIWWVSEDGKTKFKIMLGSEIHSVLRNTDSKIVVLNNTLVKDPLTKHEWTASEITIKDTRCFINGVNITTLEFIEPKIEPSLYTKPLFTTEDGIDIYEGQTFLRVMMPTSEEPYKLILKAVAENNTYHTGNIHFKNFASEEKAKEYILLNKPCLSFKDVIDLTTYTYTLGEREVWYDKLKTLAKQKSTPTKQ